MSKKMGSSRANLGVMGLCALAVGMMMILMAGGVAGQQPASAPVAEDCTSVLVELVDCLPYAMGQVSTPAATCCTNLSSVIDSTPQCLCQLYNDTFASSFGVNVTDALQLPSACKVTTPDPSLCALVGIPVPGPTASVPAAATSPAPGGQPASAPVSEDCTSVLVELVDCLPYATGQMSTPAATCCTNLSSVIDSTPQCLCQLYNDTFASSFGVNITDALQLPSACKLTTPDPSLCALIGIPVPGPASSMSPSGSAVPTMAPTASSPAGTGTTPSTTASPPQTPNRAPSITNRGLAVALSLLFALGLLFH